jgi:hypothetical protein
MLLALSGGACGDKKPSTATEPTAAPTSEGAPLLTVDEDDKFAPGQVWKVAALDSNARLVVLRVERTRDGERIIHAAVEGIEIKTPQGVQSRIGHLPFARAALDSSVTELAGKAELPPFEEGYRLWREAFEKGEGGVFTVSVAEAVEFVGQTVSQ